LPVGKDDRGQDLFQAGELIKESISAKTSGYRGHPWYLIAEAA